MLLPMVAQLQSMLRDSPAWVRPPLVAPTALGTGQRVAGRSSHARVKPMPADSAAIASIGLLSAYGGAGPPGAGMGSWLPGVPGSIAVVSMCRPDAKPGTCCDRATKLFELPGSGTRPLLVMGIFLTENVVGILPALQPTLDSQSGIASMVAALHCALNGIFVTRRIRLLRHALPGTGFRDRLQAMCRAGCRGLRGRLPAQVPAGRTRGQDGGPAEHMLERRPSAEDAADAGAPPSAAGQAIDNLRRLPKATGIAPPAAGYLSVLPASAGNVTHMVPLDKVVVLEAADKPMRVMRADHGHLIRTPPRDLLPRRDPRHFWQIHRSHAVQARAIDTVAPDETGTLWLALRGRPGRLAASRVDAHRFKAM